MIGLSGGIDSSVTAILLKEQGYNIIGVYMQMHSIDRLHQANIERVKKITKYLDIPFYIHNIEDAFYDEVYDYFVQSYKEGLTPNPCVVCNRQIKFGKMIEFANELECDYIATGHYVRVKDGFFYKGVDPNKDQSYFLARVKKEVTKRVIFPLGEWIKEDVKRFAYKIPLLREIATQKESSEICFVENSYIDILKEHIQTNMPGVVRDLKGRKIGHHKGFMHYTIGKRRGFFVKGAHEPHYVVKIDAATNTLYVGKKEDLAKKEIVVGDVNLFIDEKEFECETKVRYRTQAIKANVKVHNNIGLINLKEPAYGVAKGQFAVFYDGDKLLGGGEIIDVLD